MRRLSLLVLFIATMTAPAYAWGSAGHAVIAELAQRRLNTSASLEVTKLLGTNVSLASISSWADDLATTPDGAATARWHEFDPSEPRWDEKCPSDSDLGCLPHALKVQIAALADKTSSVVARATALKFVVNLTGDLTQPYRCMPGTDSRARAIVDFSGTGPDGGPLLDAKKNTVHQVVTVRQLWDSTLIDAHVRGFGAYVDQIDVFVAPLMGVVTYTSNDETKAWADDCRETLKAAQALQPADGAAVGSGYQTAAQPLIDVQLAKAGLRLAALLNATLK